MLQVFKCPRCQKRIETNQEIGQEITCPYCGEVFALRHSLVASRNTIGNIVARFLIPIGYVLFVAVPLVLTVRFFMMRTEQQEQEQAKAREQAAAESVREVVAQKPKPQSVRVPHKPQKPGNTPKKAQPETRTPEPETPPDPEIAIAPEPHEVELIPAAPEPREIVWKVPMGDYASKWQAVGAVDVRLAGLAIAKVPILGPKGETHESPTAMLVATIEVRLNKEAKNRKLQSWTFGRLHYATMFLASGSVLTHGDIPPGSKLYTGLRFEQPLVLDQLPVRDVLVFAVPATNASQLSLRLDAERFGELGDTWIKIPDSAWKK